MTRDAFRGELLRALALAGPAGSSALCRQLGVTQPTFSRRVSELRDEVLVSGRGRRTRYAARRSISGVDAPIPLHELPAREGASTRHVLDLHPVQPAGFYAAPPDDARGGTFHEDLPWFLHDVRPAGFLGRLIPQRHQESGAPPNISLWSTDHVVRYAVRYGWDLPGAFILGEAPHEQLFEEAMAPTSAVAADERERQYPAYASDVLGFGVAGSSAAGEQPKFLATRQDGEAFVPVIVKFSPAGHDPVSRRVADLLVAEHLALETIRDSGHAAARSSLIAAGGRTFLEVERFDRRGILHRSGVVSLFALDAEYVGSELRSWTASVRQLAEHGVVPSADVDRVRWREAFGRFIGDTDQHFGNLSFALEGARVTSLAPAYDVLPSHYAPRGGELSDAPFRLPPPGLTHPETTRQALGAAETFWKRLTQDERVSEEFRGTASQNGERLVDLRKWLEQTHPA